MGGTLRHVIKAGRFWPCSKVDMYTLIDDKGNAFNFSIVNKCVFSIYELQHTSFGS